MTQYLPLKLAFIRWAERIGALAPTSQQWSLRRAAGATELTLFDPQHRKIGVDELQHLSDLFRDWLIEGQLSLALSKVARDSPKRLLKVGVWPEGPRCKPRVMSPRIIDHNPPSDELVLDGGRDVSLQLWNNNWVYLELEPFEEMLERTIPMIVATTPSVSTTPSTELKKPSKLKASDPELLQAFKRLQSDTSHPLNRDC